MRDDDDINVFELNLTWNHPCNTNGPINFKMKLDGTSYADINETNNDERTITGDRDNYIETIQLRPAFNYTFSIMYGKRLDSIDFNTDEGGI